MSAAPTRVSFTTKGGAVNINAVVGETTANIAVLAGDKVVIAGGTENQADTGTVTLSLLGGLTSTITIHQSDSTVNYSPAQIGSADVTGSGNIQGKISCSVGSASQINVSVWVYRDHGGIGTTGKSHQAASTAPSLTLTGCRANSAIAAYLTDWSASNTARTYTQINGANPTEEDHFADGLSWHYDAFDYADVGSVGDKTLGESAPAAQTPNLVAVEVLALPNIARTFNPIPFM